MSDVNEIREHIAAVEQTRKITNAMNLVSTARLKRVMKHIEYNHRYFRQVQLSMKDILSSVNISHKYLTDRGTKRTAYIVVGGDRGLDGAYDANLLKFAVKRISETPPEDCMIISVGIIVREYFRRESIKVDKEIYGISQNPSIHNARELAYDIFDLYDKHLTDEVMIIYTSFYGETKDTPVLRRLLPVMKSDYEAISDNEVRGREIRYIPSAQEVFDSLVPQYTVGIIFEALVQAYASEHFSRMNAMQNATKNADKMIESLKMQYNIVRQSRITTEIAEISGSSEALSNTGR